MSDITRQYSVSVFPCREDGAAPGSAVTMELTGDSEDIRWCIQAWRDAVCSYGKMPRDVPAEGPGFRLCDGFGEDAVVFCEEAEILSSLLAFFCDLCQVDGVCGSLRVTVREILYQGAVYRDAVLCDLPLNGSAAATQGMPLAVKLRAKKDGRDTTVYFFGPYISDNYLELQNECANSFSAAFPRWDEDGNELPPDDDDGQACDEDFIRKNLAYDLWRNPSGGIVETGEHQTYVWNYPHTRTETHTFHVINRLDEHGNPLTKESDTKTITALHIFLEADGQNVTFSVLLDGRLYRKISHDPEKIVFYDTPLDRAARTSDDFHQGENPRDLIFRNTGGAYRYDRDSQAPAVGPDGLTLIPPPSPDPDSLDQAAGRDLYESYLKALCHAISNAETYRSAIGRFRRGEAGDGRFCLQTEEFLLTGIRNWKLVRHRRDPLPIDYRAFLEDYPGEDMLSCFHLESAVFTEERTGNTITLTPEDACTIVEFEKDEFGDDALDMDGNPLKCYIPVASALRIRITDPVGGELYSGDFSELRKGNVFGDAKLPETIRFSRKLDSFSEDFQVYQTIKEAILTYTVRKILAVFTRETQMDWEEMEQLLYANGEVPDKSVTALAVKIKRQFIRTGEIPNIALVGQAGTGKSSMIRCLGAIFGKRVRFFSPSELKGAYIGHTEGRVVRQLAKTLEAGEIFFIDEAYELMSDKFGREAVALLLPVMSGDRSSVAADGVSIDFVKREITEGGRTVTYKEPGYPPIWIAGYEDEIRLMLGQNKGLYRRIQRLTLNTPTPEQLYEALLRKLKGLENSAAPRCCETLTRQFRHNREMLIRFFRWGAQPQNSRYFANYAGVERFLDDCVDGIDFTQPEDRITDQISEIITDTKRDVKRQLDTLRRKSRNSAASGSHSLSDYDDTEFIQMIFDNKTRFTDLEGCESQVAYMQSVIDMFKDKSLYDRRGLTIPKGALLLGPPGVGKTLIARAMAGELQAQFEDQDHEVPDGPEDEAVPGRGTDWETRTSKRVGFMSLSAPEIITRPVSFIGSIFDKAEEYDVCVIFIDEVDAIAKNRFQNNYYSHFIELIKQMDGVEQRSNVFILAATNAPEALDPAFVRSGRIDKKLEFALPSKGARKKKAEAEIEKRCREVENYTGSKRDEADVETLAGAVAELTPGNTMGDIENIINDAFIMYYKDYTRRKAGQERARTREKMLGKDAPAFSNREFGHLYRSIYEMVERTNIGDPRPVGKERFQAEKNDGRRSATSVHEVGHALVRILSGRDPFEKITSLPRGNALGYVMPKRDVTWTKKDYEDRIRFAMGGRAAEEIIYGPDNISLGASSDIRQATNLARVMVEGIGFTEELGFMTIREPTARYLGGIGYNCSESFRAHSDQVVNDLLKRLYRETREMLLGKEKLMIALAREVFRRETMTGEEFKAAYEHLKGR